MPRTAAQQGHELRRDRARLRNPRHLCQEDVALPEGRGEVIGK